MLPSRPAMPAACPSLTDSPPSCSSTWLVGCACLQLESEFVYFSFQFHQLYSEFSFPRDVTEGLGSQCRAEGGLHPENGRPGPEKSFPPTGCGADSTGSTQGALGGPPSASR